MADEKNIEDKNYLARIWCWIGGSNPQGIGEKNLILESFFLDVPALG